MDFAVTQTDSRPQPSLTSTGALVRAFDKTPIHSLYDNENLPNVNSESHETRPSRPEQLEQETYRRLISFVAALSENNLFSTHLLSAEWLNRNTSESSPDLAEPVHAYHRQFLPYSHSKN